MRGVAPLSLELPPRQFRPPIFFDHTPVGSPLSIGFAQVLNFFDVFPAKKPPLIRLSMAQFTYTPFLRRSRHELETPALLMSF